MTTRTVCSLALTVCVLLLALNMVAITFPDAARLENKDFKLALACITITSLGSGSSRIFLVLNCTVHISGLVKHL